MNHQKATTLATVIIVSLLFSVALVTAIQTAAAEMQIGTKAFVACAPAPLGVGQTTSVTLFIEPIPPTPADRFHNLEVTITSPDGKTESKGPYSTWETGTSSFLYTPANTGTYTIELNYPGETFESTGATYTSAQASTTLTVQQEQIASWQETPLPIGYWTRPINAQNRLWTSISGNWLMRAYNATYSSWDSATGFNPYSQAARAPHVMWTKPIAMGGLVGGAHDKAYDPGLSYHQYFTPPIIMNGILFYNTHNGYFGAGYPGFKAVDIRTGQDIYENDQYTINYGFQYLFESPNQHGVEGPYLWSEEGTTWHLLDALTGELKCSFANASSGKVIYGQNGEMYVYMLDDYATNTLSMWNSTLAFEANGIISTAEGDTGGNPMYTMSPGTYDWSLGIQWTKATPPIDFSAAGGWMEVIGATGNTLVDTSFLNAYEIGYDLTTGKQLWVNKESKFMWYRAMGEGIYANYDTATMTWTAYDATSGAKLWTSQPYTSPWAQYVGSIGAVIAYGKLYHPTYGGFYALDIKTGEIAWSFSSGNSGLETPYGTYPFYMGPIIADGVVYAGTSEHSPTQPLIRGEKLFALDANTGKELWSIDGIHTIQAIADGYLVGYNGYDNQIYCFGKGPSATTVSAPNVGITQGSSLVISGTVTDESAGQPGTPAIADADMGKYMAFLKEQQPIDMTQVKGVPVKLRAQAPEGSTIPITEVTSDSYGNFFCEWTPPDAGMYKIVATFAGSDSYGGSSAETAISVKSALSATINTATTPIDVYIIAATVLVIIAIAVAVLILRKK